MFLEFGQHHSYGLKILRMEILGKQTPPHRVVWFIVEESMPSCSQTSRKREHMAKSKDSRLYDKNITFLNMRVLLP